MKINKTHSRTSAGALANYRAAEVKRLSAEGVKLSKIAKMLSIQYSLAKTYLTLSLTRELEAATKPKWISVDDRLPEESGAYWTFNGDDEKPSVIQQRVHMYDSNYKQFNCHTVTHWQPLPPSPEVK